MGYRLLWVGSDAKMAETLQACALTGGYELESAVNGAAAMQVVQQREPQLVVLDQELPDMDGLAWLKMVRHTEAGRGLPVMVVSARKAEAQMSEAYAWGAEDYVEKGCEPAELAARVRAVLRRRFEREEQVGYAMSAGPIQLDPGRHECRVRGKEVRLRPREFELLEILMRKTGRVLSRSYLLESVWGMSREASTRAVDVGVSRLRRALGPRAARWVETVERFGYRLRLPEQA